MEQSIHTAKILIVDDEPSIVTLLHDILSTAGFTAVRSATDVQDIVDLYQTWHPDLIILDIHMHPADGFQIMAALTPFEPDYLPILVLTGDTSRGVRQRALETGARDFLNKPFSTVEALARIRNVIEVRLLQRELRMHNAMLEDKVRERTQELQETRMEIIRRLGRAVEYRDNATGLHVIRMSYFAESLARAYGLSERECDLLLHASPMHDIGKIGIPDRILLKPGQLDPEEWAVMQTHAAIGAELLSGNGSDLMQMAYTCALTHHERWDGSGYPQGLREETIPLVGRITAICDVFDALTSTRPYKRAWSVEEALREIEMRSGTYFDPTLVTSFLDIFPEISMIQQRYADPHPATS